MARLRAGAAAFTVAGSAVGVFWDVVDAKTAYREGNQVLTVAYAARATAGISTIGTTVAGVFLKEGAIWLLRINIYAAVVVAGGTFVIGKFKGEAWVNWLLAQPFRVTQVRDADKNAFMGKAEDLYNKAMPTVLDTMARLGSSAAAADGYSVPVPPKQASVYSPSAPESQVLKANTASPFRSEEEMMKNLADVLSEMK